LDHLLEVVEDREGQGDEDGEDLVTVETLDLAPTVDTYDELLVEWEQRLEDDPARAVSRAVSRAALSG
jgi:hypothetical protein